jgi:hypothetical protein
LPPSGENAASRQSRLWAAYRSVDYWPTLMQTLRHHVRERFGEWDPGTLIAVHDWLTACHGFSAEGAWEVRVPELLALLQNQTPKVEEGKTSKVQEETKAPQGPRPLLTGWHEITKAVGRKHSDRDKIKRLNKFHGGPITDNGPGTQPRVDRDKLIDWWNTLASYQQERANRQKDIEASTESQHKYGRSATVVPEIGGEIKKRRRRHKPT